jgi:hypothetical protein
MSAAPFDFAAFEQLWLSSIEEALAALRLPDGERLYALAFWLFYGETGGVIHAPAVGLADETAWEEETRMSPADWRVNALELPAQGAIDAAYHQIGTEACGGVDPETVRHSTAPDEPARDAAWDAVFERSIEAVIAVCRELTARARARRGVFAGLPLSDDFVAVVCDPAQGDEGEHWLRACVDEPLRSRLFPDL